jgi:outer membrane receptor protein involved in Fe transport
MARLKVLLTGTCLVALAAPAWAATGDVQADAPAGQASDSTSPSISSTSGSTPTSSGDVIVTGTRIVRPNSKSAAPITSITRAEIQAQAPINVEEVLNRMPQVDPDSQQNYQDSDGRQRIKLRNLGFERTLVLVDGKRLGTQNGEDVGMIPTALLDRIDILSGGASSVYGTDAVAGVVNFIMRKDFDGIALNANYGFYNHKNRSTIVGQTASTYGFDVPHGWANDGGRSDISLTAGKNMLDGRLNITGFVDYRHVDQVNYADRETSACQITQPSKDSALACTQSTYSYSGYISPQSGPNSGFAYVNNPHGSRTFVPYGPGAGNAANPYTNYPAQRADKRINAGSFITLKLSPAAELYSTVMWFKDKSVNTYPARVYSYTVYGDTPYQVNCNNPFMSASQASAVCGSAAGTSTLVPLEVRYRFSNLPQVPDEYLNKGIRVTAGIRGTFAEAFTYDVGGVYARNRQDYTGGNYPDFAKVNNSLNVVNVNGTPTCVAKLNGTDPACVPFDAFKAGNSDDALSDYLFTAQSGTNTSIGILYNMLANVTADLGKFGVTSPFAEQGLALAAGVEYRKDVQIGKADAIYRSQNGGSDSHLQQHAWEGNIEAQLPLVQHKSWTDLLQVNGGYRLSRYSSVSKNFSTWKAEAIWSPIADITFRGSINKSQRAPTVVEAYQAGNVSYSNTGAGNDICASTPRQVIDPVTGQTTTVYDPPTASIQACRATGLPDNLYGSPTLSCPEQQCTVRTGGFTLTPETAYTKTFGVVLKPRFLPGLTVSVDRYLINLNQSIGFNFADFFSQGCAATGDAFYCSKIIRDANNGYILYSPISSNPTSGFIQYGTLNLYKAKSHGWDIQAQYALSLGTSGRLDWSFNGSRPTLTGGQDAPNLLAKNCVGYYGPGCGPSFPKWQHGLRTTYTTANNFFSASFNWRYYGPLTITYNSNDPGIGYTAADARTTFNHIKAYNYFDLALTFKVSKAATLRLTANNLFDTLPPIIPDSYNISLARNNTIPARYDSLGRNIVFGLNVRF